jgi:hypothetical protein
LNKAAAQNAIAATTAQFGCSGGASSAAITCAIAATNNTVHPGTGAGIADFAGNGLDSDSNYLGGFSASASGLTVATGAAFPGLNPNVGTGLFILPIGRSGYDALQVVLQQQKSHPAPGIMSSNIQISYNLSRIVTSNGSTSPSDQFFAGGQSFNNDDPNRYIGRSPLDHTNELSFGGNLGLKYGLQVGMIGHFFSATAVSLTLDQTAGAAGQLFQTDVDGDGTIGDLVPGTGPGAYEHEVKNGGLNRLINTYNATSAGSFTPAGQAVISAGLFSPGQLRALQGVQQPIALGPDKPWNNPALRTFDLSANYPIRLGRFHEGMSLVPGVAMYNVFNMSNFAAIQTIPGDGTAQLINQANSGPNFNSVPNGYVNGPNTEATANAARTSRNSGTFDQGGPRTTEFQLKLNF